MLSSFLLPSLQPSPVSYWKKDPFLFVSIQHTSSLPLSCVYFISYLLNDSSPARTFRQTQLPSNKLKIPHTVTTCLGQTARHVERSFPGWLLYWAVPSLHTTEFWITPGLICITHSHSIDSKPPSQDSPTLAHSHSDTPNAKTTHHPLGRQHPRDWTPRLLCTTQTATATQRKRSLRRIIRHGQTVS